MAIAPITGMMKKHLLTNLSIGIGGGVVAGYAFWVGIHQKNVARRDQWYLELQKSRAESS
ncbi:Cytochrome c oxidase subunit 7A [Rhodotorula sphaerocarpa]